MQDLDSLKKASAVLWGLFKEEYEKALSGKADFSEGYWDVVIKKFQCTAKPFNCPYADTYVMACLNQLEALSKELEHSDAPNVQKKL